MRGASLGLGVVIAASCAVDEPGGLDTIAQESVVASWDGDYETGDILQWAQGVDDGLPSCTGSHITVQTSPLRQGSRVGRFEISPSCIFDSGTSNPTDDRLKVEVSSDPDQTNGYAGSDAYYGWSFMVPASTPVVRAELPVTVTQWKLQSDSGNCSGQESANVEFNVEQHNGVESLWMAVDGGQCGPDLHATRVELGPMVHDQWQDLVMHARWSSAEDGLIEVWWNGRFVTQQSRANLFAHGTTTNPVRAREGAYRRYCRYERYDDDGDPNTPEVYNPNGPRICDDRAWVVYHDAMRRSSSYQDVALPNFSFERWPTASAPLSWVSTGSTGFTATSFARSSASSWSSLGCSGGSSGSASIRISGRHDATTTALARGVRQEDGVKSTRIAPARNYEVRANICSVNAPNSRGYRVRVFWFRADGSPSSTVSSTGPDMGANAVGLLRPRFAVASPVDAAFGRVQVEAVSATPNDTVDFHVDLAGLWNN